ncbi:hypothetical protein [Tenacibaculum geojense]|uniref:Uncharacterized protein n=1 Tax=Tenacibaculum geojense TaxID=915352 RepID=A0ABW3JTL3_9FLAO
MITEYLHYKLKSCYDLNKSDLVYLTTLPNKVKIYKSLKSELSILDRIISVTIYVSFYDNELIAVTYNTSNENFNSLHQFINSFANNENELLFEDVLGGNSDLFCIQNDTAIHLDYKQNDRIDFKVAVPINNRKNKVFV